MGWKSPSRVIPFEGEGALEGRSPSYEILSPSPYSGVIIKESFRGAI